MPVEILQYINQHGKYICFLLPLGVMSLFDFCFYTSRLFLEHLKSKKGAD